MVLINKQARELAVSKTELFRWLIDYGLDALDGGVDPEVEVVDVRDETWKGRWTSKISSQKGWGGQR